MKTFLVLLVLLPGTTGADILTRPWLQALGDSSVVVLLECTTPDSVTVEFGLTSAYGFAASTDTVRITTAVPSTYVHAIRLHPLLSDTMYHYRATQNASSSPDAWFQTPPPAGSAFRLGWLADNRTGSSVYDQIAQRLLARQPLVVLHGGDVCLDAGYTAWKSEFFRPNGLDLFSRVPFFLSPGNHEGWTTNTKAFTRGPDSPSGTRDFYSFDIADVHVLVLNTELPYTPGSPQYQFAQNDLFGTDRSWKIVTAHKPAYCSGGHGEDTGMKTMTTNLFEPAGVDLVLAGHSHFYQHNLVNGIHHLVIGSAGAPFHTPTSAAYTLKSVRDYNYAVVDVSSSLLRVLVYNNLDAALDTLELVSHPNALEIPETWPAVLTLEQNYPNPFNAQTSIRFLLPGLTIESRTSLRVFDLLGRQVAVLIDRELEPGEHTATFNAEALPSGIYVYQLRSGAKQETRCMLLLK